MISRVALLILALSACAIDPHAANGIRGDGSRVPEARRIPARSPGPGDISYAAQNMEVQLGSCPGPRACLPPPVRPVSDVTCSAPAGNGRMTCDFKIGLGPSLDRPHRCSSPFVYDGGMWLFSPARSWAEICRPLQ